MGVKVGDRVRISAAYLSAWRPGPKSRREPLPIPEGLDRICEVVQTYPPGSDYHEYVKVRTDTGATHHIPEGSLLREGEAVAALEDALGKVHASNDALRRLTEADNG